MAQLAEHISLIREESDPSKTYSRSSGKLAMFDTLTELTEKISLGEDSTIELKRELPRRADLADEITAFANARGGVRLIGVDSDSTIVGLDRQELDRAAETVVEICQDNIEPPLRVVTDKPRIDGKELLKIEVPRGLYLHKSPNGYFIRHGSSTREMSPEWVARSFQKISQVHRISFDGQFVPNTNKATLRRHCTSDLSQKGQRSVSR